MSQYQTLFAIVEDSCVETPALRRAVALARATGARLHLCMLTAPSAVDALGVLSETVRDLARATLLSSRRDWLEDYALTLREQGIRAAAEVLWQEPGDENLILRALELQPDLIIKDLRPPQRLHLPFASTTDQKLLSGCPWPLMLVHCDAPALPQRVVAAVDPIHRRHTARHLNERILQAAFELALQVDAQAQVVSVAETPAVDAEPVTVHRRNHRRRLRRLTAGQGVPSGRVRVLRGEPATALRQHVERARADLLVIGTLYRGGVEGLLLGSQARSLAAAAPCDLLAIKPAGFDEDFVAIHGFHALHEVPEDPNLDAVLRRPAAALTASL